MSKRTSTLTLVGLVIFTAVFVLVDPASYVLPTVLFVWVLLCVAALVKLHGSNV